MSSSARPLSFRDWPDASLAQASQIQFQGSGVSLVLTIWYWITICKLFNLTHAKIFLPIQVESRDHDGHLHLTILYESIDGRITKSS